MTTLVVGASGATGKHLVNQLLISEQKVKIIVRSVEALPDNWKTNNQLSIIQASILDIDEDEMAYHLKDCDAVASCLGHNLNFKGLYGKPRRLVTDAVQLLCNAIKKNEPEKAVKFVLMNTSANRNRDLNEAFTMAEKMVIGIVRLLIPPHSDNEQAAEYLRSKIGQNDPLVQWVAVRPDALVNDDCVSEYTSHPSPVRSAVFNAGKISRINVGHFMAKLITDSKIWNQWIGQMPILYNKAGTKIS